MGRLMTDELNDDELAQRIEAALARAGYQPPTEIPDEALLSAAQFASELTRRGYRISPKTLDTKVSRPGATGSPPYEKWGPWRRYRWGPGFAWAQARLSKPARTSAEHRRISRAPRPSGPPSTT
jgi:hypothetical protein